MKALLTMLAAAALLCGCGERLASGGGDATETGNARVAGQVVREDGAPMAGAEVCILPSDYDPVDSAAIPDAHKDTTDDKGHYHFAKLRDGDYNLQVQHRGTHTRSILFGIKLADDSLSVEDTLHAPGSMSVPLPETRDSGVGYVYVPGTTFRKRIDSEVRIVGSVLLDSLPPGLMPSIVYTKGGAGSLPVAIASDIPVKKSQTTYVDAYATWPHSVKFLINTTATGVATSKDQTDFPMLVRLNSAAFDFPAAAPGGADIRFSASNGAPLAREISSWDARAGQADIWVRVDTVHAGNASQYITMHWGKPGAGIARARRPVFDTLAGFAGVWHLDEEAPDTAANGLYKDATGAGSNGDDRIANTGRAGVVGAGHGLDSGDYIVAPKASPGLKLATSFTIAIWFRTTLDNHGAAARELISIGDNYGMRVENDSVLHFWYWPAVPPVPGGADWNAVDVKSAVFLDGNWHQAFGSYDGATMRLYVDGNELGNLAAPQPVGLQFPVNVTMGKHGNGKPGFEFAGDLDEAQVHSAVRDPDWIKMSFENQKAGSKFPAMTVP